MKLSSLILLAMLLAGCQQAPSDNYRFEREQVAAISNPKITVVSYPSLAALRQANPKITGNPVPKGLMGFSRMYSKSATPKVIHTCVIHIVDPKIDYDPTTLGHELTHCIYGEFHPSQN